MNRRDFDRFSSRFLRVMKRNSGIGRQEKVALYSSFAQAACAIITIGFTFYVFSDGLQQRRQDDLNEIAAFEQSIRPLLNVVTEGSPPSIKLVNYGGGTAVINRIDVYELPAIELFSTSRRINAMDREEFNKFQAIANKAARRMLGADSLEAITNNKNTEIRMNVPVHGALIPKDGEEIFVYVKKWDEYISDLGDFERQLVLNWGNNIALNGTMIYIEYESYTGRCRYTLRTATKMGEPQGECEDVKNIGFVATSH